MLWRGERKFNIWAECVLTSLEDKSANCTKLWWWWWCDEDPRFTEASISQGHAWRTPRSAVPWGGGHGVGSRPVLFLSLLHLDALDSFKVNLLMSLLQWPVSPHILKCLVPMVLKICCDWELFQCKVLVKIQHMSRAALNKDCTIFQIILELWQFSCTYNVTFHWSIIIDLKLKSIPCFIKDNSDILLIQSLFDLVNVTIFEVTFLKISIFKVRYSEMLLFVLFFFYFNKWF